MTGEEIGAGLARPARFDGEIFPPPPSSPHGTAGNGRNIRRPLYVNQCPDQTTAIESVRVRPVAASVASHIDVRGFPPRVTQREESPTTVMRTGGHASFVAPPGPEIVAQTVTVSTPTAVWKVVPLA